MTTLPPSEPAAEAAEDPAVPTLEQLFEPLAPPVRSTGQADD